MRGGVMSDQTIQLMHGDCLFLLPLLPDNSIDLILTDLPYQVTSCSWDVLIPFDILWGAYNRIIKPKQAIVLTATQPFTSMLISSNYRDFKYCWYWRKNQATGFQNAKKQPLRIVEEAAVFMASSYYPQGLSRIDKKCRNSVSTGGNSLRTDVKESHSKGSLRTPGKDYIQEYSGYPTNVLDVACDAEKLHPTQKPVALLEYLIRTYTNPGDTVLDSCMGSGSTAIACMRTGRRFIGIEKDEAYFRIASQRVKDEQKQGRLFTV